MLRIARFSKRLALAFVIGLVFIGSQTSCKKAPHSLAHELKIAQTITLSKTKDGLTGSLVVLRDPVLNRDQYGLVTVLPSKEAIWELKDQSLIPMAELELHDETGAVSKRLALNSPWAELEQKPSFTGSANSTFLLMEDMSVGMGSYNGPITSIFTITDGQIQFFEAKASDSILSEKISLMRSIKNDWKTVPSSDGKSSDILEVSCRPNFDDKHPDRFSITYKRYTFKGPSWVMLSKQVDGFWEGEPGFPDRSLFP